MKGELVPEFVRNKSKIIFDVDGWTLLAWLANANFIASSTSLESTEVYIYE